MLFAAMFSDSSHFLVAILDSAGLGAVVRAIKLDEAERLLKMNIPAQGRYTLHLVIALTLSRMMCLEQGPLNSVSMEAVSGCWASQQAAAF